MLKLCHKFKKNIYKTARYVTYFTSIYIEDRVNNEIHFYRVKYVLITLERAAVVCTVSHQVELAYRYLA